MRRSVDVTTRRRRVRRPAAAVRALTHWSPSGGAASSSCWRWLADVALGTRRPLSSVEFASAVLECDESGALKLANQVQIAALAVTLAGLASPPLAGEPWEDPQLTAPANAMARRCLVALRSATRTDSVPLTLPPGVADPRLVPPHRLSTAQLARWLWWASLGIVAECIHPRIICALYIKDVIPAAMGYVPPLGTLPDTSALDPVDAPKWVAAIAARIGGDAGTVDAASTDHVASLRDISAWLHATERGAVMSRCIEAVPLSFLGKVAAALTSHQHPAEAVSLLRSVLSVRLTRQGQTQFRNTELVGIDAIHRCLHPRCRDEASLVKLLRRWISHTVTEIAPTPAATPGFLLPKAHKSDVEAEVANERIALASATGLVIGPLLRQLGRVGETVHSARVAYACFAHFGSSAAESLLPLSYAEERKRFAAGLIQYTAVTLVDDTLRCSQPRVEGDVLRGALALIAVIDDLDSSSVQRLLIQICNAAVETPYCSTSPPRRWRRAAEALRMISDRRQVTPLPIECHAALIEAALKDSMDGTEQPLSPTRITEIVHGALCARTAAHQGSHFLSLHSDIFKAGVVRLLRASLRSALLHPACAEIVRILELFAKHSALGKESILHEDPDIRACIAIALLQHSYRPHASTTNSSNTVEVEVANRDMGASLRAAVGLPPHSGPVDALFRPGDTVERATAAAKAFVELLPASPLCVSDGLVPVMQNVFALLRSMTPPADGSTRGYLAAVYRTMYELLTNPDLGVAGGMRCDEADGQLFIRRLLEALMGDLGALSLAVGDAEVVVMVLVSASVVAHFGPPSVAQSPWRDLGGALMRFAKLSDGAPCNKVHYMWTADALLELHAALAADDSAAHPWSVSEALCGDLATSDAVHALAPPMPWSRKSSVLPLSAGPTSGLTESDSRILCGIQNAAAGIARTQPPAGALSVLMCWMPSVGSHGDGMSEVPLRSAVKAMLRNVFDSDRSSVRIIVGDERTVHIALAEEELRRTSNEVRGS